MKTLEEYEEEKRKLRFEHGTGIQCPACGDELVESDPGVILTSNPPRKTVHCQTCKYKNTITA
jgi:DNA-directed RNA polymerase subunit RPC12/RpoP